MDLATILIAVVSILICSIPIFLGRKIRKKREQEMINQLNALSTNKTIRLTKYELQSNFIIGLDDVSNTLFFLNKKPEGNHFHEVNLANFIKCDIHQSSHQEGENNNSRQVIDRISLRFYPVHSEDKNLLIELYNREETETLTGEIQLAQDWAKLLQARFN